MAAASSSARAHAHHHLTAKLESSGLFSAGLLPRFRPAPGVALRLAFPGVGAVGGGQRVPVAAAAPQPAVEVAVDAGAGGASFDERAHYALLIADPDAPSPARPAARWWLHALTVDIPGTAVSKGAVAVPWAPPSPPEGVHRYVALLARQPSARCPVAPGSRARFDVAGFLNAHQLEPVAVEWFACEAGVGV